MTTISAKQQKNQENKSIKKTESTPKIMKNSKTIQIKIKKFLLVSALALNTILLFGQDIADISKSSDGRLTVWNSKYSEISRKYTFDGDELSGFSPEIIVITSKDKRVTIYDQNFSEISYKYLYEGDRVKNVCGDNIVIKNKNGLMTIYDIKFSEKSHRYE